LIQTIYKLFAAARCDRFALWLGRKRLRILGYHAVCEDHLAGENWVPPYFVTRSAFEYQLAYLRRSACVLSLSEAIECLCNNSLPERCVAITFDDAYANNLYLAYPLLKKYNLPATIFLTTQYVETGEFFPYDRIQLIRFFEGRGRDDGPDDFWLGYRTEPLGVVLERVSSEWSKVRGRLSPEQCETLRPLRVNELEGFDPRLVDFGPHTHRHPILRNESPATREMEISTSIEKVKEWTSRPVRIFSYPNGDPNDFGELDKQVLRAKGVNAAVTAIPGANRRGCDLHELRRYSVGLYHTGSAFVAEASGFRSLLLSMGEKIGLRH
jgi:peptidoglycan/xylan/chitin deacetylase (PgdA/CDA1 family)